MEKVYSLKLNKNGYEVDVVEHKIYHRDHLHCEVCGRYMEFKITERAKKYSGWTGNLVYEVTEYCPTGCESFVAFEAYRCKEDGKLYTSNFTNLQEKIEFMIGEKTWKH